MSSSNSRRPETPHVHLDLDALYALPMDVAVSEFRANLSHWLRRAQEGDEIVVTERGLPVARIVGVAVSPLLDRLTAEGVIGRPTTPDRPAAAKRSRPRARRPVASRVSEQRR